MVPNLNIEDIGGSKKISMVKKTKEKRYENASSVIVHLLMKAFWQFIHKPTKKSNQCNHCDYSSPHAGKLRTHLKTCIGEKFSQMQPVYFEDTFEGAQWRKIKQVHQCTVCTLGSRIAPCPIIIDVFFLSGSFIKVVR